ncbi:MAG: hypothetical protein IT249_09205 [Chitinophagaceae bacterium]|nr:hypothetical protein [Chitinophagaceae bacterium]
MNAVYKKLKKVPVVSKQELLVFLSQQETETPVKLTTSSGYSYIAFIINCAVTREDGYIITAELLDDRGRPMENYLHLSIHHILSIEIFGTDNAVKVLSLGRVQSGQVYEVSGKLDVNRAFKTFSEKIKEETQVDTGAPEMELPADGQSLNRIVKLTGIIQQTLSDVLKSEDARESWQEKYNKIAFINSTHFDIINQGKTLQIHFPFADTEAPEIQQVTLADKIMSVL